MRSSKSAIPYGRGVDIDPANAPVIVGVGQEIRRDQKWPDIAGPHELIEVAARRADADAGGGILDRVDSIDVVNIFSWNFNNAPDVFSDMLGIDPKRRMYGPVGGSTPQAIVSEVASLLGAGEIEAALVCGGECVAGKRAAKDVGERVAWPMSENQYPEDGGREPVTPPEMMQRMMLPIVAYPLFEPAFAAAGGRSLVEQRAYLGELMSSLSQVAAANEYAWFPQAWTPGEIAEPSDDNRMISAPYTKRMNAILNVDQAAAILLTTAGRAAEWGVPEDRMVYVHSGAGCNDIWYMSERTSYSHSPAMRLVHNGALAAAGVGADDVAHFDFYSCFPSAVQMAMEALGLELGDERGFTVTGGLPYFGGPGNNYVTHSIAAMAERLRAGADEAAYGLVTGVGWMVTKHAAGVYSMHPPEAGFRLADAEAMQAEIDAQDHPVAIDDIGDEPVEATIDAYSAWYGKDGEPESALALVRFGDNRTPAATREAGVVSAFADGDFLGATVKVKMGPMGPTFDL